MAFSLSILFCIFYSGLPLLFLQNFLGVSVVYKSTFKHILLLYQLCCIIVLIIMNLDEPLSGEYLEFKNTMQRNRHIVPVGLCIIQFEPLSQDPFYAMPIAKAVANVVESVQPVQVLRDIRYFQSFGMVAVSDCELEEPRTNAKLFERTDHEFWGNFMELYGNTEGIELVDHLTVKVPIDLEVQP